MRMRRTLAYLVFASCVLGIVLKNRAAEVRTMQIPDTQAFDAFA